MNSTFIKPLMTSIEIAAAVETVITPENGNREAAALIRIIYAVANFENPEQAQLAHGAIAAAYRQTEHFGMAQMAAFEEFTSSLELAYSTEQYTTEKSDQPVLIG